MTRRWQEDVLGPDYRARTLHLADDDEGPVTATVIRHAPSDPGLSRPSRAVLYLHGWSDYFFQTELAEFWTSLGAAFYALDLRKYGRSLQEHQTPGYVDDLETYDEEIALTLALIHRDLGTFARVMMMGHSTGGLTATLWVHRNPGQVHGLILNSPWLELQGSSLVRHLSTPAVGQLARIQPKAVLPNIDGGFNARTVRAEEGGEWSYREEWRPTPSFAVRPGWLAAIMAGHARVARGLDIETPVLMLTSSHSMLSTRWSEDMRSADVVLDVEPLVRRAVYLGPVVTVIRIDGGLHDLTLSSRPVRTRLYAELSRWSTAYGWS